MSKLTCDTCGTAFHEIDVPVAWDGRCYCNHCASDRITDLEGEYKRLTARGIEDMQHSITHLQAVVEAWRELVDARDKLQNLTGCGQWTLVELDAAETRRNDALARLVELDQIEPVREGQYLVLKETTT